MAKIDGLDGLCNIQDRHILCLTQALDFYAKNKLADLALSKNWSKSDMLQAVAQPLHNISNEFKRSFAFSIPTQKAKTKNGKDASPAIATYTVTMGLSLDEKNNFSLTKIGQCILTHDLSIPSYALILLSKVGVYDENNERVTNLLTQFCKYAKDNPNASYTKDDIKKVLDGIGPKTYFDSREDIAFNAFLVSGFLSVSNGEKYIVHSDDSNLISFIATNGDNITSPNNGEESYMGDINKGIVELITRDSEHLFYPKYKDLINIKFGKCNTPLNKHNNFSCGPLQTIFNGAPTEVLSKYAQYLPALRTKPFLLLAGISGTGKSRIVRELARSCYEVGSEEYTAHKPKNFEMIQVKPNWHDSTELLGYVSRISGTPEFVAGDFLRFIVKAWENLDTPHFLCLDEMNLAPVEQYFAEYLSVVESRKFEDGKIVTDPIIKPVDADWYGNLVEELTKVKSIQDDFKNYGIPLPQNLFVVGTVNMDETTYSFSRKVLDRAMTIEMNEVDLNGGLQKNVSELGHIDPNCFKPVFVEGCDVYDDHKELCDKVIDYLTEVNNILEGTPFKIAYRTRNEFLVYAVNRQLLAGEGSDTLNSALDEMTSMKILSRIEGDAAKTETVLKGLDKLLKDKGFDEKGISLSKIKEMQDKLMATDYCSFWS